MNEYIIATSSTSDLPRTWLDAHGIPFIPYTYTVNDTLCEDDCREESRAAVYQGMRAGDRLKTSMINEFVYYDFFKGLLETGKDVIFLDMSREMSASFANANMAAELIRKEYPNQRLYVMDTYCISGGLGTLVENMVEQKEAGASFDDTPADMSRAQITKADLYARGLSGGTGSAEKRRQLLKKLELSERMSADAMLDVLNALMDRDAFYRLDI